MGSCLEFLQAPLDVGNSGVQFKCRLVVFPGPCRITRFQPSSKLPVDDGQVKGCIAIPR